ncbi:hypothetical protein KZ483_17105 [Paenibacillus sp. sptzw28]|uniref:hypothetical protein n=1 Tax=Paenibacillus sp. sptzw28 TaxID=715179 RepID=UPI001C6F0E49|nr:hypothetical protein [Paenibacillus sp. sptzw28]QYR19613.1 hypothetical protein KZ483_17105 [Paenibacillus sp. sptzw28]
MKEKQKRKWEKLRAKGKKNFIIFNGVISWGVPTAILYTFLMSFMENYSLRFNRDFFEMLILSIVLFPFGGIFFGLWVWSWTEKQYRKNSENK